MYMHACWIADSRLSMRRWYEVVCNCSQCDRIEELSMCVWGVAQSGTSGSIRRCWCICRWRTRGDAARPSRAGKSTSALWAEIFPASSNTSSRCRLLHHSSNARSSRVPLFTLCTANRNCLSACIEGSNGAPPQLDSLDRPP